MQCRVGSNEVIDDVLALKLRDRKFTTRNNAAVCESAPDKVLKRRYTCCSLHDVLALATLDLLRLFRAKLLKGLPKVRDGKDNGCTLRSTPELSARFVSQRFAMSN